MVNKTNEEIQALKDNWLKDPCWDIEDTPGFEDHKAELLAFHNEQRKKWDAELAIKQAIRFADVQRKTGIGDFELAQTIATFSEIENEVKSQDKYIGSDYANVDEIKATLAQAQVRATLLLAAQVKRVADILEDMDGRDSLAESARVWGSG